MQSEQIGELAEALAKAQGAMEGALKSVENTFFKSKYADLASVWSACRKPLSDNGLSVVQLANSSAEGLVTIDSRLLHKSGQWVASSLTLKPAKNDPQGIGSALSYGRRYTLAALVGVVAEDDDGEAAMGRTAPPEPKITEADATALADEIIAAGKSIEKACEFFHVTTLAELTATDATRLRTSLKAKPGKAKAA